MRRQIVIPNAYRHMIRAALIGIPIISILAAALTLPAKLSVPLAILLVLAPILLDRFAFRYRALLVMPGPSEQMDRAYVGTLWMTRGPGDFTQPCLGLMYWNKRAAMDAYEMLKAWNYGFLDDNNRNISLTIVREGSGRFSLLVLPGDRHPSHEAIADHIVREFGAKAKAAVVSLRYYIFNCVDYSTDPRKLALMEQIPLQEHVDLNCFYKQGDGIVPVRARAFKLHRVECIDRPGVEERSLLARLPWKDLRSETPKSVLQELERIERRSRRKDS